MVGKSSDFVWAVREFHFSRLDDMQSWLNELERNPLYTSISVKAMTNVNNVVIVAVKCEYSRDV